MTPYVVPLPDPPVGTDFGFVVPGRHTYDVTGITATLATGGGLAVAHDVSGNGRNGVYQSFQVGFPADVAGLVAGDTATKWGDAALPGNQSDVVLNPSTISYMGDHAIEAWARVPIPIPAGFRVTSAQRPAGNNLWFVDVFNNGVIRFLRNSVPQEVHDTVAGAYPNDGFRHHVTVSYTNAAVEIRVDGVLQAQTTNDPRHPFAVNPNITIPGGTSFPNNAQCTTDEVAIYEHGLTGAQVAAHIAAAGVSFAAYTAAVLADTPALYYHLDDSNAATGRQPSLIVTDGTTELEAIPTGFPAAANPGPYSYAWQPQLNADSQSSDGKLTTVAVPRLILPAGYTVGARTLDLQPADQWSKVALWWDDQYQNAINPANPYRFPGGIRLRYHQIGTPQ